MRALYLSAVILGSAAFSLAAACSGSDDAPSSPSRASSNTSSSSAGAAPGAGGGDAGVPEAPDATDDGSVGEDAEVIGFDRKPIYFTGSDNQRTVDAAAEFPASGKYKKVILHLSLECPKPGGCDPWDRFGTLGLVTQHGADGGADTVIELARFITPYHVGAQWDLDVTDLQPLLAGKVTLRAFIDTWVGPGSQYGDGWLLSARFSMKAGAPAALPVAVVPVWTMRSAVYGDPAKPIAGAVPPQTVTLPAASSYALRTFVTGHGQGNADNCAEFCSREHTITVGATPHKATIWRTDCATTAAPHQQGTYQYPRAGWCPGADVKPWTLDVTKDVAGSATAIFGYDVQSYENTCRPDAATCTGCTLGTGCPYDGGAHTEPNYEVSTVLIAYR